MVDVLDWRKAREVLDNVRGNINPERGYADELEADVVKAIAAIDAATSGAAALAEPDSDVAGTDGGKQK